MEAILKLDGTCTLKGIPDKILRAMSLPELLAERKRIERQMSANRCNAMGADHWMRQHVYDRERRILNGELSRTQKEIDVRTALHVAVEKDLDAERALQTMEA